MGFCCFVQRNLFALLRRILIPQRQLENISRYHAPGKVILLYGARRVGKTTLVKKLLEETKEKSLFVNGDAAIVVIDEAQYIKNIGLNLN